MHYALFVLTSSSLYFWLLFHLRHTKRLVYFQALDVPKFLLHLRRQRMMTVQTLSQYTFIYKVIIQYLRNSRLIWAPWVTKLQIDTKRRRGCVSGQYLVEPVWSSVQSVRLKELQEWSNTTQRIKKTYDLPPTVLYRFYIYYCFIKPSTFTVLCCTEWSNVMLQKSNDSYVL